jgi:predicted ester cyclase
LDQQTEQLEDRNAAAVRFFIEEVLDGGRLDLLEELVAPGSVLRGPFPEVEPGPEGMREFVTSLRKGFPNFQVEIDDVFAAGDKVAVRWHTTHQTHLGPYRGIPPTGREIQMTAIEIFRMENGQVADCWIELDQLGAARQMGVAPPEDASKGASVLFVLSSLVRMPYLEIRHRVRR